MKSLCRWLPCRVRPVTTAAFMFLTCLSVENIFENWSWLEAGELAFRAQEIKAVYEMSTLWRPFRAARCCPGTAQTGVGLIDVALFWMRASIGASSKDNKADWYSYFLHGEASLAEHDSCPPHGHLSARVTTSQARLMVAKKTSKSWFNEASVRQAGCSWRREVTLGFQGEPSNLKDVFL